MHYTITAIIIAVLCIAVLGFVGFFYWGVYGKNANPHPQEEFTVKPGDGVKIIAQNLLDHQLIRNRFLFETEVWLEGVETRFIAGTYVFAENVSAKEVIDTLTTASKREQIQITIPEGYSNKEIAALWEEERLGTAQDFLDKASVLDSRQILPNNQYDFFVGKPASATLEGYLYPDTYFLFADSKPEDLIKKMLDNFGLKTKEFREAAGRKGKSLHEVLTLAAIVEREVPKISERPIVAGVFANRLAIGMALQSDATVNYATGKYRLQPTFEDLAVDSVYNTYKHPGLPPGPIGNPSMSALSAALDPEMHDFFYFLSKPSGETVFSKTLEEHNANKAKYLP